MSEGAVRETGRAPEPATQQRERVHDAFLAYAAAQSELCRRFARHLRLHTTDAVVVMEILRAEQPLTPARLAEHIGLTSGAMSLLLTRLQKAGHLTRRGGHADRRIVTLHLEPAIQDTAEAFFAPLRAQLDALMGRYRAEQLNVVETFVSDLRTTTGNYRHPT